MMQLLTNSVGETGLSHTIAELSRNTPVLDAIEGGIRLVESDPDARWVGLGGTPNMLGQVELDATIMDGRTLEAGSVGALNGYLHPISVARQVMARLPHVMLVGDGAARFAREIGAEAGDNLTEKSRREWLEWVRERKLAEAPSSANATELGGLVQSTMNPATAHGTTIFLAQDRAGNFAAGSSSSGWGYKHPGRLGDSAIVGAGCYADNRYGAAACTGMGELTMRTNAARTVVLYLKMGMTPAEACEEVAKDMRFMPSRFRGGITLYAIDTKGDHSVLAIKKAENQLPGCEDYYFHWQAAWEVPRRIETDIVNW
jgi:L-asparaginase